MGCLKNLVITSVGDVGYRPEQLRKWVEANSGRWVTTVTKNLTHLICSKECWKRGNEAGKSHLPFQLKATLKAPRKDG
jgi:hypothetical protein